MIKMSKISSSKIFSDIFLNSLEKRANNFTKVSLFTLKIEPIVSDISRFKEEGWLVDNDNNSFFAKFKLFDAVSQQPAVRPTK